MWQTGCVRGHRGPCRGPRSSRCRWGGRGGVPRPSSARTSRAITPRRASRGAAAAPARRTWAAPPAAAPLAGRWARIPSRRRRPVTDEPARVSRGGAQSRHLAPAIFFVVPVSEMTFGGRSRSGPLAPNRHWSRMGAMRGRARSAAAERRRGAAPTATCALGGRGAAICAPRWGSSTDPHQPRRPPQMPAYIPKQTRRPTDWAYIRTQTGMQTGLD